MIIRWFRNLRGHARGYGGCLRCGRTWDWEPHHTTQYTSSKGCFPLCEKCWAKLTPEERLPYYGLMVRQWLDRAIRIRNEQVRSEWIIELAQEWPLIEKEVLSGR